MSAIDLEALKAQATRAHRMTCSDPDDPTRETPYSVQLKLLAALEAVAGLHRKVPVYVTEAGDCKHGWDCQSVEIDGGSMCPDETEGYTCGYCAELNTEEYPNYPCATIQTLTEALS